ncbi:subtilisin sub1 [Cystoisospora suis]|uniref:subtilisin n=1 Tax=Cystoisospora suis TaxID=483139 RepID=A0A2C6L7B3_9APIC|nr:subtilisin sub1 [Cystoisospora suis]
MRVGADRQQSDASPGSNAEDRHSIKCTVDSVCLLFFLAARPHMARLPCRLLFVAAVALQFPGGEALHLRRDLGDLQSGKLQTEPAVSDTDQIIAGVRQAAKEFTEQVEVVKQARQAGRGHDEYADDNIAPSLKETPAVSIASEQPTAELVPQIPDQELPLRLLIVDRESDDDSPIPSFVETAEESDVADHVGKELGGSLRTLNETGVVVIDLPSNTTDAELRNLIDDAKRRGGLVEPDHVVKAFDTSRKLSDDPLLPRLWGFDELNVKRAWDLMTTADVSEDNRPVVCVADSGVDYLHPDLKSNIYVNEKELNGTPGVDDDGNGQVDDIFGANMISRSNDPQDDQSHGTHVAGTIGAHGNNGMGVTGVAWRPKIVPCKFIGADGTGSVSAAIRCIDYCVRRGAKVLNHSWGGPAGSVALLRALNRTADSGVVHVAAAGNERTNIDIQEVYPAAYSRTLDNVISVANAKRVGPSGPHSLGLARSSNYGKENVQVACPGTDIESTVPAVYSPAGRYASKSGTSMAAPALSGIIALMLAANPELQPHEIKELVHRSVKEVPALVGKVAWAGIPDARVCVEEALAARGVENTPRPAERASGGSFSLCVSTSVLLLSLSSLLLPM